MASQAIALTAGVLSILIGMLAVINSVLIGRILRLTTLLREGERDLKLRLIFIRIWGVAFAVAAFMMLCNTNFRALRFH
jgi:hypothetical protein